MINTLIVLGLIVIPCYEFLLRMFPNVVIIAKDTREPKEMMAIGFALAIGLSAVYLGKLKKFSNFWLLLFLFFQIISIRMAPYIPFLVNDADSSNFWAWKPFLIGTVFTLMIVAVSSIEFSLNQIRLFLKVMCCVATFQACYVIIQTLGFDQLFSVREQTIIGATTFPERVGLLGQPTLVSPFIAMMIPITLYLRGKYWILTGIMAIGVLLTHSQMALGTMVIGIIAYFIMIRPKNLFWVIPQVLAICLFVFIKNPGIVQDNGRFTVWNKIIAEMKDSSIEKGRDFSMTGNGPGSFQYLYPQEKSIANAKTKEEVQLYTIARFSQAHNDFLEIFYHNGFVGLFLFLMTILYSMKTWFLGWINNDNIHLKSCIMASFASILVCAMGSFVFQLGAHIFYTAFLLGLLHNEIITGGEKCLEKHGL